jgi:nucleoid-associated protein Lsr2
MAGAERLSSMAQRVQVVLEDDLDGGKADETVTFGLDGTTYEIDLSKKNAAKLRDALAGYVGSGRRVSGRRGAAARGRGRGRAASDSADIRAWAKDNGYDVSERGRISAEVRAAYNEAK